VPSFVLNFPFPGTAHLWGPQGLSLHAHVFPYKLQPPPSLSPVFFLNGVFLCCERCPAFSLFSVCFAQHHTSPPISDWFIQAYIGYDLLFSLRLCCCAFSFSALLWFPFERPRLLHFSSFDPFSQPPVQLGSPIWYLWGVVILGLAMNSTVVFPHFFLGLFFLTSKAYPSWSSADLMTIPPSLHSLFGTSFSPFDSPIRFSQHPVSPPIRIFVCLFSR